MGQKKRDEAFFLWYITDISDESTCYLCGQVYVTEKTRSKNVFFNTNIFDVNTY